MVDYSTPSKRRKAVRDARKNFKLRSNALKNVVRSLGLTIGEDSMNVQQVLVPLLEYAALSEANAKRAVSAISRSGRGASGSIATGQESKESSTSLRIKEIEKEFTTSKMKQAGNWYDLVVSGGSTVGAGLTLKAIAAKLGVTVASTVPATIAAITASAAIAKGVEAFIPGSIPSFISKGIDQVVEEVLKLVRFDEVLVLPTLQATSTVALGKGFKNVVKKMTEGSKEEFKLIVGELAQKSKGDQKSFERSVASSLAGYISNTVSDEVKNSIHSVVKETLPDIDTIIHTSLGLAIGATAGITAGVPIATPIIVGGAAAVAVKEGVKIAKDLAKIPVKGAPIHVLGPDGTVNVYGGEEDQKRIVGMNRSKGPRGLSQLGSSANSFIDNVGSVAGTFGNVVSNAASATRAATGILVGSTLGAAGVLLGSNSILKSGGDMIGSVINSGNSSLDVEKTRVISDIKDHAKNVDDPMKAKLDSFRARHERLKANSLTVKDVDISSKPHSVVIEPATSMYPLGLIPGKDSFKNNRGITHDYSHIGNDYGGTGIGDDNGYNGGGDGNDDRGTGVGGDNGDSGNDDRGTGIGGDNGDGGNDDRETSPGNENSSGDDIGGTDETSGVGPSEEESGEEPGDIDSDKADGNGGKEYPSNLLDLISTTIYEMDDANSAMETISFYALANAHDFTEGYIKEVLNTSKEALSSNTGHSRRLGILDFFNPWDIFRAVAPASDIVDNVEVGLEHLSGFKYMQKLIKGADDGYGITKGVTEGSGGSTDISEESSAADRKQLFIQAVTRGVHVWNDSIFKGLTKNFNQVVFKKQNPGKDVPDDLPGANRRLNVVDEKAAIAALWFYHNDMFHRWLPNEANKIKNAMDTIIWAGINDQRTSNVELQSMIDKANAGTLLATHIPGTDCGGSDSDCEDELNEAHKFVTLSIVKSWEEVLPGITEAFNNPGEFSKRVEPIRNVENTSETSGGGGRRLTNSNSEAGAPVGGEAEISDETMSDGTESGSTKPDEDTISNRVKHLQLLASAKALGITDVKTLQKITGLSLKELAELLNINDDEMNGLLGVKVEPSAPLPDEVDVERPSKRLKVDESLFLFDPPMSTMRSTMLRGYQQMVPVKGVSFYGENVW